MDLRTILLLTGTGFWALGCSVIREYHFVNSPMTRNDAYAYCASHYTALASVRNNEDLNLLYQAAGTPVQEGWIGLYHNYFHWSWSIKENPLYNNVNFLEWANAPEGDWDQCAYFEGNGSQWYALPCERERKFVCQNAEFKYFLIKRRMDWTSALKYCRTNYIDLASIRNEADRTAIADLAAELSFDATMWIGLHNRWRWVEGGRLFTFHSRQAPHNPEVLRNKCVFLDEGLLDTIVFDNCYNTRPFYCHRDVVRQQSVRVTINSPYNIDSNTTRQIILQQVQHELSKHNPEQNLTVKWKEHNGQVFRKDTRRPGEDKRET